MKSARPSLAALICGCWLIVGNHSASLAATPPPSPAKPSAEAPAPAPEKKNEFYVALYMQGSYPLNRPIRLQDDPFTNTDVQGGLGGGLKVGVFPAFAGEALGLEADISGMDGSVDAPARTTGGVTRSGTFRLQSINAMANLLLRYPGDVIQPYIGVGAGLSGGFARDLNLQHSTIGFIRENAADGAFAYQFLGGIRANVSERVFVFTEYKYFVANYQWESEFADGSRGPSFTLNYRAHIISGGVGFSF